MPPFLPPRESGADGVTTDILNPAKPLSYSAVSLLRRREEDEAITNSYPTISEPCTSPSLLSSSNTGNSNRSACVDFIEDSAAADSLYVHPFAHPSARSNSSEYSSPNYGTKVSASFNQSSTQPASSVSFIKMGKATPRQSAPFQPQGSGHHWGRSVSDGFPQMIQRARKKGSRFLRALARPSLFSPSDVSKDTNNNSPPTLSAQDGNLLELLEKLPPRPAPYFYPRHVDSSSSLTSGQTMFTSPNPGCRSNIVSADDSDSDGENDRTSTASVDSVEIGSWKENRKNYLPTISEMQETANQHSLRQRLGASIVLKTRSTSPSRMRCTSSEVDLAKLNRELGEASDVGPGFSDDPFAASPNDPFTSTPFCPKLYRKVAPSASLSTVARTAPTKRNNIMNSKHRSSPRTRLDSIDRPEDCTLQSAPSMPPSSPLSISIPPPSPKRNDKKLSSDSMTPLVHEPVSPSSQNETPSLTPDRPSFSSLNNGMISPTDTIQSSSSARKSDPYFPSFDTSQKFFDQYEENAIDEIRRNALFYGFRNHSGSKLRNAARYNAKALPPAQLVALSEKDDLEDHKDDIVTQDVFPVDPDLASLKEAWPLPPRRTLFLDPTPGMSWQSVSRKVEYFKPGSLRNSSRLRIVGHSASHPDISAAAEEHGAFLSRLLQNIKSEPHISSIQQPSDSSASVVAVLGDTVLENTSFPSIIDLQPRSEPQPSVMLVVRATSLRALILFCASHEDTIITASPSSFLVHKARPIQAYVRLRQGPRRKKAIGDVVTLFVEVQHAEPESTSYLDPSSASLVRLPVTMGELAVLFAKKKYDRIDGVTAAAQALPQSY